MDTYYYSTYSTSNVDPGVMLAIFAGAAIFALVIYAVFAFFLGKIFKKAGEDAWKAWVPVYNQWVFLELGGQQGWIALLSLAGVIPFVGWIGSLVSFVFACVAAYQIGLKLQKEAWFVVLYILVSPVWIIWLAVDSSTWKGTPVAANANPANQPPVEEPEQNNTPTTPPVAS